MGIFGNRDLERENKMLRAQGELDKLVCSMAAAVIECQGEQIGKLRELCGDMLSAMCDWYAKDAMADACDTHLGCDVDDLVDRARAIGVEVR